MANLIVLRQSPDWRSFDIEATRLFCAKLDLPEDMIVEFAEIWDSQMALSFLEYRQAIKEIAMDGVRDCKDAVIIDYKTFEDSKPKDGDTIYFTDDDDWVSPNIFGAINSHGVKDLLVWGSVYVGQMYFNTPQAKMEDPVVALRPLRSDIVYTNNYALASSTVRRLGLKAVLAHEDAQVALNAGRVKANALDLYLTAANKHPCCAMAILFNMKSQLYRRRMKALLDDHTHELQEVELPTEAAWCAPFVQRLIEVNRRALG